MPRQFFSMYTYAWPRFFGISVYLLSCHGFLDISQFDFKGVLYTDTPVNKSRDPVILQYIILIST